MFQVLARWLCYNTIKLCSTWGRIVLQASLLPTFQGKGQLQPPHQVRNNEACSGFCARGLKSPFDILFAWLYLLFIVFSFHALRFPLEVDKTWFCLVFFLSSFQPSYNGHVCCVWLIDGFQIPTNVKLLAEEFQLQILDSTSDYYFCILLLTAKNRGESVSESHTLLFLLTRIIIHMLP